MQSMKGEIRRAQQMQAGVTHRGWIPAAGNSHPYEADLGFGSVPKAEKER